MISAAALFDRLRRADADERQQLKWFAFAGALVLASFLIQAASRFAPSLIGPAELFATLAVTALRVAVGVAILRYRLYDIDLIINRTVVYVLLTAILAGVYTAVVALFQRTFVAISGQGSDLAIVMTLFVLATVFTPIKNTLQERVDRRIKPRSVPVIAHYSQHRRPLDALGAARPGRPHRRRVRGEEEAGAWDLERALGHALQCGCPRDDETAHIRGEEEPVDDRAERTERTREREGVDHRRATVARHEFVDVAHRREWPAHHLVLKHSRRVETCHAYGQSLPDPKMPRLPGDLIPEPHKAGRHPGDRSFFSAGGRPDVSPDVPREIEGAFR
jgi:hypothetical protein